MNVVTMSYGILAPISMISQLILIYGYLKIKKMRKHPEMMIFWQCITQSLMDLHSIPFHRNSNQGTIPFKLQLQKQSVNLSYIYNSLKSSNFSFVITR